MHQSLIHVCCYCSCPMFPMKTVPNENCRYVFGGMSTSVQSTTEAVQQEYIISAFTFPSMWRFSLTARR